MKPQIKLLVFNVFVGLVAAGMCQAESLESVVQIIRRPGLTDALSFEFTGNAAKSYYDLLSRTRQPQLTHPNFKLESIVGDHIRCDKKTQVFFQGAIVEIRHVCKTLIQANGNIEAPGFATDNLAQMMTGDLNYRLSTGNNKLSLRPSQQAGMAVAEFWHENRAKLDRVYTCQSNNNCTFDFDSTGRIISPPASLARK